MAAPLGDGVLYSALRPTEAYGFIWLATKFGTYFMLMFAYVSLLIISYLCICLLVFFCCIFLKTTLCRLV